MFPGSNTGRSSSRAELICEELTWSFPADGGSTKRLTGAMCDCRAMLPRWATPVYVVEMRAWGKWGGGGGGGDRRGGEGAASGGADQDLKRRAERAQSVWLQLAAFSLRWHRHTAAQPWAPLSHLTISRTAYCRQMKDKRQKGKNQLPRCVSGEPWDGARAQSGQRPWQSPFFPQPWRAHAHNNCAQDQFFVF